MDGTWSLPQRARATKATLIHDLQPFLRQRMLCRYFQDESVSKAITTLVESNSPTVFFILISSI